jgi:hypothetical protein
MAMTAGGRARPIRYPATNAAITRITIPRMFPTPRGNRGGQWLPLFARDVRVAVRDGVRLLVRLRVVEVVIDHILV